MRHKTKPNRTKLNHNIYWTWLWKKLYSISLRTFLSESPRGTGPKMVDSYIAIKEFQRQFWYYIHVRINTFGKWAEYPSTHSYGLNSTEIILEKI